MEEWKNLLQIAETLLGPKGCPWDREQTLSSLQPYLLEETHELLEAIDLKDSLKIKEELGDVFYTLIFIAKLGEQRKDFSLSEALQSIAEKLVRRHPHVFGNEKIESLEGIEKNWEKIKKREGKQNPLGEIPPSLPALARAQKVIQKLRRAEQLPVPESSSETEEGIGKRLWDIVREAEGLGIDAESALRRTVQKYRR